MVAFQMLIYIAYCWIITGSITSMSQVVAYFVEELRDDAKAATGSPHAEVEVILVTMFDNDGAVVSVTASE